MLSSVILSERGYPAVPLVGQLVDQRFVRPGPLVLGTGFLKLLTRGADGDRTYSLPCPRHPTQEATSRHRGAKPSRRYGLLGKISLLSPGYLLSVERHPFHSG